MQREDQTRGFSLQAIDPNGNDFLAMLDPDLQQAIVAEQPVEILNSLNPKYAAERSKTSTYFQIHEHSIPGQHIRGYPGGIRTSQEDVLYIAVKQYVPVDRVEPVPEDAITIIGLHANGFVKASPHSCKYSAIATETG